MSNPLVCIFNPVTTFIDEIPSSSVYAGASAAGQPVVLNAQGLIDPSLISGGSGGITATAGEGPLSPGALVNLYNSGGLLYMQNASAAATGTSPSGSSYPVGAVGFVNNQVLIHNSSVVLFSGVFTYQDTHSEFSATAIGSNVYLSTITPGGITLTRPSGSGQLQQEIGVVVGFSPPNSVQVNFSPQPQSAFSNFSSIISGTNTSATMTVGSGSILTFTGSGVVNANQIYGVAVSSAPATGQVLTATSTTTANWQTPSSTVNINNQTTSYIAALSDANQLVTITNASASTFTIPPNSSVAFIVGTALSLMQLGTGQITLTPGSGVTIYTPSSLLTRTQYSTVMVTQVLANTWVAGGDLS